jgi:hypothetical protein
VGKELDAAKGLLRQEHPESLHNLACAQWWHILQFAPEATSEERELAKLDAKESTTNFAKAVQLFEGLSEPFTVTQDAQLSNPLSGLSLTNIAEICIQSDSLDVAVKWLKFALEFYTKTDRTQIGRALALMGVVLQRTEQFMHAEGLLNAALKTVKGVGGM